jgi:hypothetical protein
MSEASDDGPISDRVVNPEAPRPIPATYLEVYDGG